MEKRKPFYTLGGNVNWYSHYAGRNINNLRYSDDTGGFSGGSDGKESACNLGDPSLIPGSGRSDPLEKGMATHFSILSWRIPWTEEPGRLQSMRS